MINILSREQLIKLYIDFFRSKNHKEILNSPLIPAANTSVLFTTAGMHPLIPYLLGEKHPQGKRLVNIQKCIRTGDIEEVGDAFHLTFFEMLGNWSLGDYWKKQSIEYSFEFLTKVLKIPKEKISATCFAGDKEIKKDEESAEIWKSLGIKNIKFLGKEDNFWIAGDSGPCGADTEIFINNAEIWNNVFMQYNKQGNNYKELKQKNIDTGMGVERTLAILLGKNSVYETPCFIPLIEKIEKLSKKKYASTIQETKSMRIIADHIKAAVFILAENITPSNKEHGYVLRRLIRRAIRHGKILMMQSNFTKTLAEIVINIYPDYPHLEQNKKFIFEAIEKEENIFRQCLASGLRFFNNIINKNKVISGKDAFLLYQSYGFPIEMTEELAKEKKLKVDLKEYEKEKEKHQELSKTSLSGQFKSGLADTSEKTIKYHTASHLLLAALKEVLGKNVEQRGSNITSERLRFDFSYNEKMTDKQLTEVEKIVNDDIKKNLHVKREELSLEEAKKSGASGIFESKYKDIVSVYTIKDKNNVISKEICSGPHIENTGFLGKFKIIKEESSSRGIRRIKAVLE